MFFLQIKTVGGQFGKLATWRFGDLAIWQFGDSAQNGVTGVEKQWINSPNYQKEP